MSSIEQISDEGSDVFDRLRRFVSNKLKISNVEISGLRRTSYGYSCENWPFDLRYEQPHGEMHVEELILRRDPIATVLKSDRAVEFEVLRSLESCHNLPTPRAVWLDRDGEYFGRSATVMSRSPGSCDPMVLSRKNSDGSLPIAMAKKFMDAVVAIHSFDWKAANLDRTFSVPTIGTTDAGVEALEYWDGEFRRNSHVGYPELEFVLAWLRAHVPITREITLVHADFKPGNTLLLDGNISAVLDWETAHLGDPLEDLAWVTNPMRAREHQIPNKWEAPDMIGYYRSTTGREIDASSLRWWGVLANFKLLTISLTGMRGFLSGKGDRPMGDPRHYLPFLLDQIGIEDLV